jgi:hypothetical protein
LIYQLVIRLRWNWKWAWLLYCQLLGWGSWLFLFVVLFFVYFFYQSSFIYQIAQTWNSHCFQSLLDLLSPLGNLWLMAYKWRFIFNYLINMNLFLYSTAFQGWRATWRVLLYSAIIIDKWFDSIMSLLHLTDLELGHWFDLDPWFDMRTLPSSLL